MVFVRELGYGVGFVEEGGRRTCMVDEREVLGWLRLVVGVLEGAIVWSVG